MGSTPTPIIIGTYCSDFTIDQPLDGADFYYYAAVDTNNNIYYIANSRATHGDGTGTNQVDSSGTDTIRIIRQNFVVPDGGRVESTKKGEADRDQNFREFRFKLVWNPQFTPDIFNGNIIPINRRRYLTWKNKEGTNAGTTGQQYTSTKIDRFVELTGENDLMKGIRFNGTTTNTPGVVGTSANSGSLLNINNSSFTAGFSSAGKPGVEALRFFATSKSPKIEIRANELKYLILKDDFDRLNTEAFNTNKQLRYLRWNNNAVGGAGRFELVDLYDPDVTTSTIQECAFRFAKSTSADLATGSIYDGIATPTNVSGVGTTVSMTSDPVTKYTMSAYYRNTSGPVPLSATNSVTEPNGFSSGPTRSHTYLFPSPSTKNDGFVTADFNGKSESEMDNLSTGYQDFVITIPAGSISYIDLTDSFTNVPLTTAGTASTADLTFIITNFVVDKTVEELFTDMNVTLLKVQFQASSPAYPRDANVDFATNPPPNNFLGLEQTDPKNIPVVETNIPTSGAANAGGTRPTDLIVRDYYKFFNPARATQFKFYDLGKGNEYLWQARWPAGFNETYTYITSDGTNVQFAHSSSITPETRGWIMEYESATATTPPGVRLRWAGSSNPRYFALTGSTPSPADNAPVRVATALASSSSAAAVFNCIQCSSLDSTGACIPITGAGRYLGNQAPPGGGTRSKTNTAITLSAGVSPVSTNSFRIRIGTPTGSILQYSLTQIAGGRVQGSPGSGVFVAGAQSSPVVVSLSPIPNSVSDFVLTRAGVLSRESVARNAVFIKSASGNQYLKALTAGTGSTTRVELQTSNRPSDDDGFAWMIIRSSGSGANTVYNLYSLYTSGSPGAARVSTRYLQANGFTLGAVTGAGSNPAGVVFEGVDLSTLTPTVTNNSLV